MRIFSVHIKGPFKSMNHTQSVKLNFVHVVLSGRGNNQCQTTLETKDSVMEINCKQLT